MNVITVTGFVGQVPEVKYTEKQKAVANISLAVKSSYGNDINWFKCVAWGKLAEVFEKYVKKGTRLLITGEMRIDTWEKDGIKHLSPYINVNSFEFIGAKSDDMDESLAKESGKGTDGQQYMNIPQGVDDELPFN